MNEFNRKTMQFVDLFENAGRRWASASPQNAYRVKEERDELRAALVAHLEGAEQKPLTDERIDHIAEITIKAMPDGIRGFMKVWGWQQFARNLAEIIATPTSAALTEEQP